MGNLYSRLESSLNSAKLLHLKLQSKLNNQEKIDEDDAITLKTKVVHFNKLVYHEYFKFFDETNVIVERDYPYDKSRRELIVNMKIKADSIIQVFDAFGTSAFETPVKVNEILFYGKSSDDGYYITIPKHTKYKKIREYNDGVKCYKL